MDLFTKQRNSNREAAQPLAARMRPRLLDDFVGQTSFLGPGMLLRRMLEADRITSALFYGPPGTGKTSLARVIASTTKSHFEMVNAAAVGVKEIRDILDAARDRLDSARVRTILFVDELHRFNRSQQDVLLGDVENGVVILIGATTENPFFAVNSPLISRSQIFQFEPLSNDDVKRLMQRALEDRERGLGSFGASLTEEAADHLAITSDGDARRALTALDVAVRSEAERIGAQGSAETVVIDLAIAEASIQRKAIRYDKSGDNHYDAISAMIKSIRGSDPDAAVYWLARMLEAGEDPQFIARRLVIAAAEDVGNGDPHALVLAQSAAAATQFIGMPECQLPLAQAAIYLACAPKSNACAQAIWTAARDVREGRTLPVPKHLKSSTGADHGAAGNGYQNPHDHEGGVIEQEYLGVKKVYYRPTNRGAETNLREFLARVRGETDGDVDAG